MSSQSILSFIETFNDVINLLNNYVDGSKSVPTENKGIHISLEL